MSKTGEQIKKRRKQLGMLDACQRWIYSVHEQPVLPLLLQFR